MLDRPAMEKKARDKLSRAFLFPARLPTCSPAYLPSVSWRRLARMVMLYRRVRRNTVFRWAERFLSLLDESALGRMAARPERPDALPVAAALESFRAARSRLVLLDYDGTLVPFAPRPRDAVPPSAVVDLVARLAAAPGVTAAIVSGRSRADLDAFFGNVPDLWLIGEHGGCARSPITRAGPASFKRTEGVIIHRLRCQCPKSSNAQHQSSRCIACEAGVSCVNQRCHSPLLCDSTCYGRCYTSLQRVSPPSA